MLTIAIFCSYYCTGGQNPPQHTESVFLTKFRPHLALAFLFDFGVCRRANFLCKVFFLWYSYKIGNMRLFGLMTTAWIASISTNVSAFRASYKGRNARLTYSSSLSSSSPSRLPPITNYHLPSSSRLGTYLPDADFKTSNAPAADPVDFIRSEISANDVSFCLLNSPQHVCLYLCMNSHLVQLYLYRYDNISGGYFLHYILSSLRAHETTLSEYEHECENNRSRFDKQWTWAGGRQRGGKIVRYDRSKDCPECFRQRQTFRRG